MSWSDPGAKHAWPAGRAGAFRIALNEAGNGAHDMRASAQFEPGLALKRLRRVTTGVTVRPRYQL